MRKRVVGLLVAGSLLICTALPVQAGSVFTDIENHWAKPAVIKLYQAGIVKGVGSGKYAPNDFATREQVITMILNAIGAPVQDTSSASFTDVPVTRWSHKFIETAVAKSILTTNSSGKFTPSTAVSRKEAAQWVSRAVPPMNTGIAGGEKAPFPDITGLSNDEQTAISHVYHLGIMAGDGELFRPDDTLTRGEAAAFIERLFDRIQSSTGGLEMTFKKVDLARASIAVQTWASGKQGTPGIHSASIDGKTYILVSRGEKPNTGYGISISKVVEEPNRIVVSVQLRNPQPGMMYAQVITTPFDLVEIPQTNKQVELQNAVN